MAGGVGKVYKTCVTDGKCPDESCAHGWYLEYSRFNKRYKKSIAALFGVHVKGRREAEKVWLPKFVAEINDAIEKKRIPFAEREARLKENTDLVSLSFGDFIRDIYMPGYYECALTDPAFVKQHNTAYYYLKQLIERFDRTPLLAFNVALVRTFKAELKARSSKTTGELLTAGGRNRLLGKLRQIIRWGHHHEQQYFPRVPFGVSGVRLDIKDERARERRLLQEPDEEDMLIEAARLMDDVEHDFVGKMMELRIIAAIDTCARRGELLRVKRADVDFDRGLIKLPKFASDYRGDIVRGTKNFESRHLPISPRLLTLLATRKSLAPHAFVFGKQDGTALAPPSLRKPWATLKLIAYGYTPHWQLKKHGGGWFDAASQERLAQIDLHWHDLRHEGASRYGESGEFGPKELMALLGHKSLEMTMRYIQLGDTAMSDAVARAHAKREAKRAARQKEARRRGLHIV